jgi:hypothetical protein
MSSTFAVTDVVLPPALSLTVSYPNRASLGVLSFTGATKLVLRLLDHELSVEDEFDIVPSWVEPVVRQLADLEQLPPGWDSHGGRAVTRHHSTRALNFLGQVMADNTLIPAIVPLADGGLQLEWRSPELEVDLISDDETDEPLLLVTDGHETMEYPVSEAVRVFRALRHNLATEESTLG